MRLQKKCGRVLGRGLERIYQHFPRLAERRKQDGVTLSGGEHQMLAIARALTRDLKLADRAVILDTGEVAFTGSAKDVLGNAQLRQEYLAI